MERMHGVDWVDRSIDRASVDVFLFLCPKCTYDTYTGVFHTHYVFRRKVGKGHAHARKSDRVHSIDRSIPSIEKEAKGAKGGDRPSSRVGSLNE